MTAQYPHVFKDTKNNLLRVDSVSPFEPKEYGLNNLRSMGTSCYRGYICEFLINKNVCILNRLIIRMYPFENYSEAKDVKAFKRAGKLGIKNYPKLNGVRPLLYNAREYALYFNLNLIIKCSQKELSHYCSWNTVRNNIDCNGIDKFVDCDERASAAYQQRIKNEIQRKPHLMLMRRRKKLINVLSNYIKIQVDV